GACGASSTGQFNVLPIALDNKTLWSSGSTTVLNQQDVTGNQSWPDAPGNWGYVSLCGSNPSASVLRSNMSDGYGGELSIGNYMTTVPGKKAGPVQQGLTDRAPTTLLTAPSGFSFSDPRAVVIPIVDFSKDAVGGGKCSGNCNVTITGFMAVYILSVSGGAITVQDIGLVIPNAVGSVTAVNNGAMGDIVLVH
ncbi:MAG TPA: hypothetical protein VHS07_06485, partial [Candidatus Binataceae bacterium]|nr:hypothetical protein [Candidatus Binataceae bacterium]